MSCGCGKKKCNGKCGISPSVLQINNNECTLFHKVEIPAVMGDETTNPPKTGAYRNVLLYYEASGNSYLYSSDGIPTKLTGVVSDYEVLTNKPSINGVVLIKNKTLADLGIISAIDSAVADEATARENADNALSDRITTNANNIAANATAISNEVTARTNADNTLSARISGNTTAINNEKTARENADTALSNRITANANAISAETTTRENADNALSGRITANADAISGEKTARENADAGLQDQITAVKATADSAVQPDDIDKTVMSDLAVDSNSSTAQVILKESKVNLKTGTTSSEQTSLPVASSSQAGVMNSATYDAVTSNTSNINAIMNGAVAITGLPANPSQSDLTTAWQNETGLSTLINRASVYDVTNNKVWTYYTNDTTWHAASNASQVTVNTFTNSSEGTIKGSTSVGQVFAENDGTGSVNGWDALSDAVSNNTSKLAGIESGAEVNVQSDWNVSDSSSDAYIKNKPTIGNGTLTIQKNGATIDTFTANSTTNKTVNITVPTVNDATLTIQKNGDTVQTFTANSSSNKTANIEVPTKTSELDNDAGFIANDTHQVCGEGGNITLDTTTFEPLEMNHLGGETSQQTYTGKNLFDDDAATDAYIQNNGSVTPNTVWRASQLIKVEPNTSYIWHGEVYGANQVVWAGYNSSSAFISGQYAQVNNVSSLVITTGASTEYLRVGYRSDGMRNMQLELGSSATSFEPYVGGVPAPNPDYPQAVQTVTGENVVKITGKNLAKMANGAYSYSAAGQTFTLLDGSITTTRTNASYQGGAINISTGAMAQWAAACASDSHLTGSGGTYTLTFSRTGDVTSSSSSRVCIYGFIYDDDGNNTSGNGQLLVDLSSQTSGTYTLNLAADRHLGALVFYSQFISYSDVELKVQLEIGSSASSFEPYQEQSYEVNLGKNLFDKDNASTIGAYIAGGTSTIVTDGANTSIYTQCQPNTTYTISKTADNVFRAGTTSVVPANGVAVKNMTDNASGTKITLTSDSDAKYLVVFIRNNASSHTAAELMATIQIEKGSQATSYAAYFEPIELCKIGDYQDYIYKSGGKWYVRKEIGKVTLNSSNYNSRYGTNQYGLTQFLVNYGVSDYYDTINFTNMMSDHFIKQTTRFVNTQTQGFLPALDSSVHQLRAYVRILTTTADTTDQFKAWLDANTPTFYYKLDPATDTEITNAALVAQLEALWEADGYDGQTNIVLTYAEGNAQGILSVCQYPSHLPVATKSKLGTIIVGHGLDIEDDGRLDVIVDSALSDSSINPVQNSVITTELNSKADISSVPTKTSQLENDSGFVVNDTTEICDEGSDITLNGTLLEPLDVKKIEGATSQQTYSGKNLLDYTDATYPVSKNGLVATLNSDGSITLTGTPNADYVIFVSQNMTDILEDGATYTISSDSYSADFYIDVVATRVGGGNAYPANTRSGSASFTVNKSTFSGYTINIQTFTTASWGASSKTITRKFQLEKGSSATTFEPYVGGTASPNPDYPQAVQTVTGENVVKICGKNLFDVSAIPYVAKRAYSTDGSELIWNDYTGIDGYQPVAPSTTYTLTNEKTSGVSYLCEYDGNKNFIQRSRDQKTFTTTADTHYLRWSTYSAGNVAPTQTQLELGSTATEYQPYQGQSYEVNLGKNLFDKDAATLGYRIGSDGSPFADGSYFVSDYIPVNPNTNYEISPAGTTTDYGSSATAYYDSSKAFISRTVGVSSGWQHISTPANCAYIRFTTNKIVIDSTQLERGSQATSYAAYFEPIELCKIGTYQDSIYKSGGKWYLHKEVGISAGSELGWRKGGAQAFADTTIFYDLTKKSMPIGPALSNYLRYSANNYGANDHNSISITSSAEISIRVSNSIATDITAFTDWLDTNGVIIYYSLATPTDTEITNEALVAQLENLWDADGVEGETNIFTVSDGVNERAILSVCQYPSHLPIATKTKLGTVVVGHGLDIEADGKLDVIVDDDFSTESEHPVQNKVITNALAGKADNTDLSTVAMTGSYDDLTGKPTIPTVNNATLTIQKNGTNVATFTANSSTNVTANITAPVVTMTTTDPGEGGALAANNFIGVYV